MKGRHQSNEAKKKVSDATRGKNNPAFGKHWFNDGTKNVRANECPKGFVAGMLERS